MKPIIFSTVPMWTIFSTHNTDKETHNVYFKMVSQIFVNLNTFITEITRYLT